MQAKGPTSADEYRSSGLPKAYHDKITFYYTYVKGDGPGTENPLNVLLSECLPIDYCVVKCDFDDDYEEAKIRASVLANKDGVRDLIDEFYMDSRAPLLLPGPARLAHPTASTHTCLPA